MSRKQRIRKRNNSMYVLERHKEKIGGKEVEVATASGLRRQFACKEKECIKYRIPGSSRCEEHSGKRN